MLRRLIASAVLVAAVGCGVVVEEERSGPARAPAVARPGLGGELAGGASVLARLRGRARGFAGPAACVDALVVRAQELGADQVQVAVDGSTCSAVAFAR